MATPIMPATRGPPVGGTGQERRARQGRSVIPEASQTVTQQVGQDGGTTRRRRPRDAAGTREALLQAAVVEFSRNGFAGARIERIVKRAGTTVRMVYHYYGSKSALYVAVLEHVMAGLRREELKLDLAAEPPLAGLLQLFDFIHDHFEASPQLISLLTGENLLRARFLKQSAAIPSISSPVIGLIRTLVARGTADGSLRSGIDPLRLYVMMVALSYFHLSNVHTLSAIFHQDLTLPDWREAHRADARRMMEAYLRPDLPV